VPELVSTSCGICEVKVNFSAHKRARTHVHTVADTRAKVPHDRADTIF